MGAPIKRLGPEERVHDIKVILDLQDVGRESLRRVRRIKWIQPFGALRR
jgi:hypothetical protein